VVIFSYACVLRSSNLVFVGPQKCCLAWHTSKNETAHNFMLYSGHFSFVSSGARTEPGSVPSQGRCSLCLLWSLFSLPMAGACLSCGLRSMHLPPPSCIRPLTSLNSRCDNFEPQETRTIQLLRMVISRRCKNIFFFSFPGPSDEVLVRHVVGDVHLSPMYFIVLYYDRYSDSFDARHRDYLFWWSMFTFRFSFHTMAVKLSPP